MARTMQQEDGAGAGAPVGLEIPAASEFLPAARTDSPSPLTVERQPQDGGDHGATNLPALAEPRKPKSRRRLFVIAGLAAVLLAAGYYGYNWWSNGRFIISTDDAYVSADVATIAPKITGYIKTVAAGDNAHVTAGAPLVVLDDSDYRIALGQADAQLNTEQATIARIEQQMTAGQAAISQAEAQLASAKAAAANAAAEYNRISSLEAKSFATGQALDAAQMAMSQTQSAVAAAEAGVNAARANAAVVAAQKTEAERVLDQYRLARAQAQLNLDHTVIRAPFDGVVGNRAAEVGEYVQPGQRLLALVPLDGVYVDANFKETQLSELKPGQKVAIKVDAYPDQSIQGTVESVAPASGSVFSLLPPDNATGNFTKIVQRVPVRIRIPAEVASQGLIRPGMSIVADVDTRSSPTSVAAR